MAQAEDIRPTEFPKLSWEQSDVIQSLDNLFDYVTTKVEKSIIWYYLKRKRKRPMGFALRYAAIVFTGLAGVIPVLSVIYRQNNVSSIDPAWSTIAIALAALMIAIDKLGGFTSAWVRYILAAQELDQIVETFRFSWETEKLKLQTPVTNDDIQRMITKCDEFLQKATVIVHEETKKWVAEFRSALKEVDEAAKAAAEAAKENIKTKKTGALSVEVENGLECDGGWKLSIDGGSERTVEGKRTSVTGIKPGFVSVQVVSTVNGKTVQDNKPAMIRGGETTTVKLNLE